jgi:hypothetical protein
MLPFVPWEADAARRRSREELAKYGIDVLAHLPLLFDPDELPRLRPAEDAIARAVALYAVIAVREGAPADTVRESLEARGLIGWLSERERQFIAQPADEGELVQMSWRVEALAALGWALGLVEELPLEGAEGAPAEVFAPIDPDGTREGRDQDVLLRPVEQLADRLDLFYCAHWAAREQQLTGHFDPWPAQLVPGAIQERRHGLEWLFAERDVDWEEVDLST